MKKLLTWPLAVLAALIFAAPVSATPPTGYVTVSASYLTDSTGSLVANGTITFTPVNNLGVGIGFQTGGTGHIGHAVSSPVSTLVTSGAFSIQLADTAMTTPANVCYSVTVTDNVSGKSVLGAGYGCVQPAGSGIAVTGSQAWCTAAGGSSGGTCNFDLYVPNMAPLAVVQTGPAGPAGPAGLGSMAGVTSDGANGMNVAGTLKALNVTANVNSVVNVMAYGAKGDCTTNDSAAITSAQTAAIAQATGNSMPGALYFPKAPGGCYLASITWQGVSLIGQVSGVGSISPGAFGVTIKGLPGQDVLHVPDPTSTAFTWYPNWSIRDIAFLVDDSVCTVNSSTCTIGSNPVFAHRWSGRWFDDGAMTSGSNAFTTTNGFVGCGDVGQQITVAGAGLPTGTTIASVTPCWANAPQSNVRQWQKITLTANAATTVTNAHTYIALLGQAATTTIGNCAIAMDDVDGKPADWVNPSQSIGSNGAVMENVVFAVTGGNWSNPVCGIYTQGAHILYSQRVRNFGFYSQQWGVVQGTAELNSYYASSSGDFETWEHGFSNNYEPWVSYNGGEQSLKDWEMTADAGLQILGVNNAAFDYANNWDINIKEFEGANTPTAYGMRITGSGHLITNTMLTAASQTAWLDGNGHICNGCFVANGSTLEVDGSQIDVNGPGVGTTIHDYGIGNTIRGIYNASPFNGLPTAQGYAWTPTKGRYDLLGSAYMPDFLREGNPATPYKATDLWIWPRDIAVVNTGGIPYGQYIQADSASLSGQDFIFPYGQGYTQFLNVPNSTGTYVIGTNVPPGPAVAYASIKCPGGVSTFNIHINTTGGYVGGSNGVSCSTTLQTYKFLLNFTGQTGTVSINNYDSGAHTNFLLAWFFLQPTQSLNGLGAAGAGAGLATGPISGTAAGDPACYADALGTIQDCIGLTVKSTHTGGGGNGAFYAAATNPTYGWKNTSQGTDNGLWDMTGATTSVCFRAVNDAVSAATNVWCANRGSGYTMSNLDLTGSVQVKLPTTSTVGGSGNYIPAVGAPTVGQAACIKSAGPPVVIGYCSTVVSSGGACTCN